MILPLACAVLSVVIDGVAVRSYRPPYIAHGRVMAPLDPYVIDVAASIDYDNGTILVRRGDLFAQAPARAFVEIGPLLRTLGITVSYDAHGRRLVIETPRMVFATPTPFNAAVPQVAPTILFTPTPAVTPRPVVTGKPTPRRTPLQVEASPSP